MSHTRGAGAKEPLLVTGKEFGRCVGAQFDKVRLGKARLVVTVFGRPQVAIVPLEDLERLEKLDETK